MPHTKLRKLILKRNCSKRFIVKTLKSVAANAATLLLLFSTSASFFLVYSLGFDSGCE